MTKENIPAPSVPSVPSVPSGSSSHQSFAERRMLLNLAVNTTPIPSPAVAEPVLVYRYDQGAQGSEAGFDTSAAQSSTSSLSEVAKGRNLSSPNTLGDDKLYETGKRIGSGQFGAAYELESDAQYVVKEIRGKIDEFGFNQLHLSSTTTIDHCTASLVARTIGDRVTLLREKICENGNNRLADYLIIPDGIKCVENMIIQILMKKANGKSLADFFKQSNEISKPVAENIMAQLVDVVQLFAKKGYSHTDLNPGNIFWDKEKNKIQIIDNESFTRSEKHMEMASEVSTDARRLAQNCLILLAKSNRVSIKCIDTFISNEKSGDQLRESAIKELEKKILSDKEKAVLNFVKKHHDFTPKSQQDFMKEFKIDLKPESGEAEPRTFKGAVIQHLTALNDPKLTELQGLKA